MNSQKRFMEVQSRFLRLKTYKLTKTKQEEYLVTWIGTNAQAFRAHYFAKHVSNSA